MRPLLAGLSLQRKFFLLTSLGIVLLTGALGYLAAARSSHLLFAAVEKQGRMLARTVAALIINERIYEKLGLVEEGGLIDNYVRELYGRKDLDFLSVAVLDENNRVISHNDFSQYGRIFDNEFVRRAGQAADVIERRLEASGQSPPALEFAAPLSIGGKRWGVLLFTVSLREVEQETRQLIWQIAAIMIAALLLGLGALVLLGRRFMGPITAMAQTMREIDSDLPDRKVEVRGDDELAMLGRSFNTMIDRIRAANLTMQQTHEKLRQSEILATLGILSSSVAHRINNPLGGLFNCVRMLEQHGAKEEFRRKYLDLIREGLESIRETVGQLLSTAGKRRGDEARAPVETVLAGIMRFLDYRLKGAGITLRTEIESGLVLPVSAHDLREMLQNILINAVQAMPAGGELEVTAARQDHSYLVRVKDSGVGIPAADLDKVFEPFFTTKPEGEGTGLGLWMTYELVKKYQGEIKIASRPGQGAIVTITIPDSTRP